MDKRKANAYAAASADADDRAAKRRKMPPQQQFNLLDGESPESTTQYGLSFMEQLRRTSDKSGRVVVGYFENLPPREGNAEYYEQTRMPISLNTIEDLLHNRQFGNMTELESYIKRMVQNAKDWFPRTSQVFEDAERVRKATSNYMVRTNPAYKLIPGYSAVPTPIPDGPAVSTPNVAVDAADGDAEGDEEAVGQEDEDAEGELEEEEDDDDDDADAEAGEDRGRYGSRRRASGRQSTSFSPSLPNAANRPLSGSAKPDHEYEGIPYNGLNFQQAQEKIVEELVRMPDEEDEQYAYFEPFLALPPRTLKDYYQVIKEPLSLRKFQKLVKGIHGRGEKTGVTEYKSWTAFEKKASLLWENAYYYNEDGSEIAEMAKELEKSFMDELKQAKMAVPDPPQPKIKLKMPSGPENNISTSRRITIHVSNQGSAAGSPAPQTGGSVSSDGVPNGAARSSFSSQQPISAAQHLPQLEKTRSMSGSAPSPSPSVMLKHDNSARQSPAVISRPNGVDASAQHNVNGGVQPVPPVAGAPQQNGQNPFLANPTSLYDRKFRAPGKGLVDALITKVTLRTHPTLHTGDRRFQFQLPASAKLTQQSVTINVPAKAWKQQIIISTSAAIQTRQRPYKLFVMVNGTTLGASVPAPNDPTDPGAYVYDAQLQHGVNSVQVHLIAAIPKEQRLPNGPDVELEKFAVLAYVTKY